MVSQYSFELENEDALILLETNIQFGNQKRFLELVLDTGATHTFIDFRNLQEIGYTEKDKIGLADGSIIKQAHYQVKLQFLHIQKTLSISSEIYNDPYGADGVLGLDFFKNQKLIVDFKNHYLSIE